MKTRGNAMMPDNYTTTCGKHGWFLYTSVYNKAMPRIHEYTCTELREKYPNLLRKFQDEMRRNAELEKALEEANARNDMYSEMVANLIKDRREKNWLYQGGDNSEAETPSAV